MFVSNKFIPELGKASTVIRRCEKTVMLWKDCHVAKRMLCCEKTVMLRKDCHVAKRLSCCEKTVMLRKDCHVVKRLSCFKKTVMLLKDCHVAKRLSWCCEKTVMFSELDHLQCIFPISHSNWNLFGHLNTRLYIAPFYHLAKHLESERANST